MTTQVFKNIKTLEINGTLTENEDKIKSEIENYFKNIFEREGYKYKGNEFIDIIKTQELNSKIDEQIKEDEIKFVLDKKPNVFFFGSRINFMNALLKFEKDINN